MKGVILAGGLGSRLLPLTKVTNKHLLPVYNKPMIYYPIETLVRAGVRDILIVTGGNSSGDFLKLLGNGKQFGLKHINYTYQEGEGGIAQALGLAEHFVGEEKMVVVLGDNIVQEDITPYVRRFDRQPEGARLLLKKVPDPERFGVATFKQGKITGIIEKPKNPKSSFKKGGAMTKRKGKILGIAAALLLIGLWFAFLPIAVEFFEDGLGILFPTDKLEGTRSHGVLPERRSPLLHRLGARQV